jgi:hypothetical protein
VALPSRPIIETRYDQMFPTLDAADIDRLLRFGETGRTAPARLC